MKFKWREDTKEQIIALTTSLIIVAVVGFLLWKIDRVNATISTVVKTLMPFIFGFCIAFILTPLQNLVERIWLDKVKWHPGTKRKIAVTVSMITLLIFIGSFFALLIPQLYNSIVLLSSSMGGYLAGAEKYVSQLVGHNETAAAIFEYCVSYSETAFQNIVAGISEYIPTVLNYSVGFVTNVFNFLVGLIIAVYIQMDKEKFKNQTKRVIYSIFLKEKGDYIMELGRLTAHMFNRFIFGKALDSLIVGIVCYIIISILGIPYSLLISFIIGITNMIPVFGPFIGAIPCAFILLIIDPIKALIFVIFILILQQIDGNILGPYILGDSMGLPSLWVMFAIIVGGGLFGVVGMFIGVPLFSVIYVVIKRVVDSRLKKKHIEVN